MADTKKFDVSGVAIPGKVEITITLGWGSPSKTEFVIGVDLAFSAKTDFGALVAHFQAALLEAGEIAGRVGPHDATAFFWPGTAV